MLDKGIKVKVTKQPAVNRLHKLKEHLLTWWDEAYKKKTEEKQKAGPAKATKENLKKQKILIYFPVLFMWRLRSTTIWFHQLLTLSPLQDTRGICWEFAPRFYE